jgi:tetratricopeptide (TPR) repeat protein
MRAAVLLLGLTLGAAAAPASAQPTKGKPESMAEAKRLFDEGEASYLRGSYEDAIASWEKAYEISKRPLIFWNIANAHERLGNSKKAREYLGRWREHAPPEEQELIDARLAKLDQRIARDEAEAKQAADKKARDEAAARERERLAAKPPPPERSPWLTAGVALAGAGVGAVAVGLTLGFVAASRRPEPGEVCATSGDRQLCRESSRDEIESSNTLAIVGDVIWIVGALATASGVALVVTNLPPSDGPGPESSTADSGAKGRTSIAPRLGRDGGGLWLRRTF